jgi:hypothetical protein
VKTYNLISFSDARGTLLDFKVLTEDAPEMKTKVPGVDLHNVASVAAPDHQTAYRDLLVGMMMVPRDSLAATFWDRVAMIPRIRVAALRRMGLRNLGSVMNVPRYTSGG